MKKLINNITEDYCSFEVSKLLKEKGFDSDNPSVFPRKGWQDVKCPTHALAIEWIRVNYGYWIWVDQYLSFGYHIISTYTKECIHGHDYNSPQEATEAALLYTLKNLL